MLFMAGIAKVQGSNISQVADSSCLSHISREPIQCLKENILKKGSECIVHTYRYKYTCIYNCLQGLLPFI